MVSRVYDPIATYLSITHWNQAPNRFIPSKYPSYFLTIHSLNKPKSVDIVSIYFENKA